MLQVIKQSHEEKLAMYMKCTKRKLAEMLANRDENIPVPLASPHWISRPVALKFVTGDSNAPAKA